MTDPVTGLQEAFVLLDSVVEAHMRAANTPGLALAVTDRDKLLHVSTHGFADMGAQIPLTLDTLFEIGSISKSFTVVALMQLREAGLLDLHAPVTHYLPWFRVPSKYEPITVHHLMSHTAGIISGTDFSAEARYEVWALRETEATAPPGTYFRYSNVGYKALGLVLEELLGQSYGEIIQERILNPLGMRATAAVITHEARKRLAVGYEPFYDDRPAHPSHPLVPATWLEINTADGSIAATVGDMAAYLRMLMNRGQGSDGRIISEESFDLMTQRVIETPEEEEAAFYGYGLKIGEGDGRTCIGHTGGMVGYYSALLADMDDGLGVVVLTNGPGEPSEIARSALKLLRSALHNQEPPSPLPLPDPTQIDKGADYIGIYRAGTKAFTLVAESGTLIMQYGSEEIALERRDPDCFYVPHEDLVLFLLRFGREEGRVVEAFHGPDWYTNDRYRGPTSFDYPQDWEAYTGHYRSHNPWYSNFRVLLRKGTLVLIWPGRKEEPMAPLGNGVFRIGKEEQSPERIRFDTVLDSQALRAQLSCCDYYRTFTP
jgi:D-alanyl-D-alanine carboxypeptidase